MTPLPETLPCKHCGGEGQIVCRPAPFNESTYTVDCEDCGQQTASEHATQEEAIAQWNLDNASEAVK